MVLGSSRCRTAVTLHMLMRLRVVANAIACCSSCVFDSAAAAAASRAARLGVVPQDLLKCG